MVVADGAGLPIAIGVTGATPHEVKLANPAGYMHARAADGGSDL